MSDRRYLRQLLAGRDFGKKDPMCQQMANFVYLVGDSVTRECVVVDPAWDIDGIASFAENDGMKITGALITHYHPDHCGGTFLGFKAQGIAQLLARAPCPIHVHRAEANGIQVVTGVSQKELTLHDSGDRVKVGDVEVELLHTPGHTPGSQCFRCGDALISGDTLFLQGCGRVDLPGGDREEMQRTLHTRLATLPNDLVLYPGHNYGHKPHAPLGEVKETNPVFRGR